MLLEEAKWTEKYGAAAGNEPDDMWQMAYMIESCFFKLPGRIKSSAPQNCLLCFGFMTKINS